MARAARRLSYAHVVLGAGFVVLFFGTGARYAFGLMLVPMTEDLDTSRSLLSSVLTLFMIVSAVAMPVVGRLIDRHSIRLVMATGVVLTAAAMGLMSVIGSVWQVFALYGVLYAVGFAATTVGPVSVLMSRWFSNNRGLAASAALTGNGMGQLVIIALLTAFLVDLGWRNLYLALGVVNVVVVAPIVLIALRARPDNLGRTDDTLPDDQPELSIIQVLVAKDFWLLAVMYTACGFQDFFVATHVVAFAQDQGVGQLMSGNLLALMGLAALIGVLISGAMADRMGAVRPTLLCFTLRIGLFAFIPFMQDSVSIAAFALIYGFTFTITAPLTVVFAANIFGTSRLGSVSGLINMIHQIAGGVGAFAGAMIFDATGSYNGAFFVMLALSVVAAVSMLLLRERPHAAGTGDA